MKLVVITIFFVLLGLFSCSSSASRTPFHKAIECAIRETCDSHDWKMKSRSEPEDRIKLIFAIKQKNMDLLIKILYEVSDPKSKKYGKHLTFEQVGELTSLPESELAVREWLLSEGVKQSDISSTPNKEFLTAELTIAQAENLLNTQFYEFYSEQRQKTIQRTHQYDVPEHIAPHIEFISNTVQFPPLIQKFGLLVSAPAPGGVTPDLMSKYYNISSNNIASPKANQSLFEIAVEQSFSNDDLVTFEQYYGLPQNQITNIIGPDSPKDCKINPNDCGESNLDVQWIMAVARNSNTTYWSIPESAEDPFLTWITQVAATANPPLVHSISYGAIESESDPSSMQSFSNEVAKAGARGLSVMVASGDDGVAGYIARGTPSKCGFAPSYPAIVPYITAVGATQGPEANEVEVMCSSATGGVITSGGGFSATFTQPSYQSTQVNNYLKNGPNLPPINLFASKGRAYPDVALMGNRYNLNIGGNWVQECGTSASSPSFAGMVSLVNGLRISQGKPPLGFLNPLLYSMDYDSFHDITEGRNNCAAAQSNPTCCKYGFTATGGWDPTTGLGTPDFANFASHAVSL